MKIQINTGHDVNGREEMIRLTEAIVESTLGHLAEHISRVEVHLSDENSKKGGDHDKRCMMEARLEGHQPISVSSEARTIGQAIGSAADKLKSALNHTIDRLKDHKGRENVKISADNSIFELE
jgi:ribosome-associated translation inhibitor RaiA